MRIIATASKIVLPAIVVIFFCTGCVHADRDEGLIDNRWNNGVKAMNIGDFNTAKRLFYEAYQRADASDVQDGSKAACAYNFAICAGQLGNFGQAESWFKKAISLDIKIEGKEGIHASMRLFELARLYQAWGKNSEAVKMYEKALPLVDKQSALKTDPIMYAIILNDYAAVLKKSGFGQKAEPVAAEAQQIREANPGIEPKQRIYYYPAR